VAKRSTLPALPQGDIDRLKSRWAEHLRRHSLKTTQQRELIVDQFLRASGHISIEELLAQVRTRNEKVGYATVYRTLKLLTECGLAAPRQFGDGQTRFEVADDVTHHHDHLICVKCGVILEFENAQIERLQDQIAERLGGFRVMHHKLELYCLCPKEMGVKGGYCADERRGGHGERDL